jgi:glycosyltransferase involved in cell wall biosynthesis
MTARLRVGYDARMALGAYRGMGSVLRSAIDNQAADFVGLCAKGESDPLLQPIAGGFHFYPIWEQISLPRRARELQLDCFLAPYNTAPLFLPRGVSLVVIVHDLIYMEPLSRLPLSRSMYQNAGRFYRRAVVPHAIARAERIVTVSEFSKREISQRFSISPDRIITIPCSIPDSWYVAAPIAPEARGDYILCVAGEAASKNLVRAIDAYALALDLGRPSAVSPELWIAGVSPAAQPGFDKTVCRTRVKGRVRFLPYLLLSELQAIYRKARMVFVPSLHEGFGIPLLEAMASGTPVVSSSSTSLPEVGGAAPYYVNPMEPINMARGLLSMLGESHLQATAIEAGFAQAAMFRGSAGQAFSRFWSDLSSRTHI